jgi:hypothetical protein
VSRLDLAVGQIAAARSYTAELLEQTRQADWFRQPASVTHIAWQVGHLTVAEYRMTLDRIRGPRPQDGGLIPPEYIGLFSYDSVPDADPARYPAPAEIRSVFDRLHEHVLIELRGLHESQLDEPVLKPHPFAKTKLYALLWCARHEMLHAGQIGLLRRQLGYPPLD